ncbi:hypothetical protein [Rhodococcoides corynebacterioides]|uniref:Asp23/Gls24 family envelope stress response protein n=1 Tax=Rhodococcoides corynebacterioides TaxID=53972 RepID=A0ABS7P390_9NOCA|nr:hypothetical protein [Rhodococcus corynebacterioides]MBY6366882.1 hypothetical protein [Rhodococcus corynebacterioides]MBY6409165.1 hypothetical protein [Rhodococcus corynebacterioides]
MTRSGGPADRAADAVRRRGDRPSRWIDVTDRAISRVRGVGVRAWPLDSVFPTAAGADTLRITDVVVRTALVRALIAAGTEVVALELYTEGHRCCGTRVTVRRPVHRRTVDVAATTLSAILGAPSAAYDVDVVTAVD